MADGGGATTPTLAVTALAALAAAGGTATAGAGLLDADTLSGVISASSSSLARSPWSVSRRSAPVLLDAMLADRSPASKQEAVAGRGGAIVSARRKNTFPHG